MLESWEYGRQISPVTALLLAENGYAALNPPEWLQTLQPQLVLLSVSPFAGTGLPSHETLQAVREFPLLRTDKNGWIELATEGEKMWVELENEYR